MSVTGRIASYAQLVVGLGVLVTVGRAWPLFYHLTPLAHHLDDVRGNDGC
jgi:hypothetical protein